MNPGTPAHEPDTEKKILEAAGKVFIRKGKLGTSMQDIADEAGINRTLLHYYFRSKDKLFDTVFDRVFRKLFPAIIRIMASDRPVRERVGLLVEAYTELLTENPYLPVFVFQEISINPQRITEHIRKSGIDTEEIIRMLEKSLAGSGLGDVDPRHVFADVMGMVLFPFIGRPIFQEIAFGGDKDAYEEFLAERKSHIPELFRQAFSGAGNNSNGHEN